MTVLVAVSYGQNDYRNCNILLQRGRMLCLLLFIPISIAIGLSYKVMINLGVKPNVAEKSFYFAWILYLA